jgi:hypothetical protein
VMSCATQNRPPNPDMRMTARTSRLKFMVSMLLPNGIAIPIR